MFPSHRPSKQVSVIMPTYNRADLLQKSLQALTASALERERFEVIVVDDGSSDGSHAVAKSFEDMLDLKYLYQPDRGYRVARARNLGLAAADGDIIVLLDCGVLATRACLSAHLAAHDGVPALCVIGYVGGFAQDNANEHLILSAVQQGEGDVDAALANLLTEDLGRDIREPCYALCADDLGRLAAPWALAWTCNVSVQRREAIQAGGFDETYCSWGAEDVDFALSLSKRGAGFRLAREAAAIHYPHSKETSANNATDTANKRYMFEKHGGELAQRLIEESCIDLNLESGVR